MKLQQLRYVLGVANHNFNVSKTADSLFTSQPGVSKQIRMLEDELRVQIFQRNGKLLTGITPVGRKILAMAGEITDKVNGIIRVAEEFSDESVGSLTIATTHTQARYVLPKTILAFTQDYNKVSFHLQQGTPAQIAELASKGLVDIAIATESMEHYDNLIILPCYKWNRTVIVRPEHPLVKLETLTLETLSKYPLVTYHDGFTGRHVLDDTFRNAGLIPNVMFSASDADVIKAYVKMQLGVGIIASVAYDKVQDADLVSIDVSHLFEPSITKIGIKRGITLRNYMYDFIENFAPHLSHQVIDSALATKNSGEVKKLFEGFTLPHF